MRTTRRRVSIGYNEEVTSAPVGERQIDGYALASLHAAPNMTTSKATRNDVP